MGMGFTAMVPEDLHVERSGTPIRLADADLSCSLAWERAPLVPFTGDTTDFIFRYVDLADASAADFLEFVEVWGLPTLGDLEPDYTPWWARGSLSLLRWRADAAAVRAGLRVLIATEQDELVDLDLLWALSGAIEFELPMITDEEEKEEEAMFIADVTQGLRPSVQGERRRERWKRWRVLERGRDEGLAYQRRALLDFVARWQGDTSWELRWNDGGRAAEPEVVGGNNLVGAQLLTIFTSLPFDVFECSVCANPFDGGLAPRRPRRDRQRFCSNDCRHEAKKGRARASWHRANPTRTARRTPRSIDGERQTVTASGEDGIQ
jgi:hypothetical protein